MVFAFFEVGGIGEVEDFAVDAGAEALLVELVEEVFEFAFAAADDGGVDGDALAGRGPRRTRFWRVGVVTGREGEDTLDDLLRGSGERLGGRNCGQ